MSVTLLPRAAARRAKRVDPFYLTRAWESVRLQALRRDDYTCQKCGVKCLGKKRKAPSPNVDHIIPRKQDPRLALELSNLRTLCGPCHSKITIADMHGKEKPEIGLDGFPVITG